MEVPELATRWLKHKLKAETLIKCHEGQGHRDGRGEGHKCTCGGYTTEPKYRPENSSNSSKRKDCDSECDTIEQDAKRPHFNPSDCTNERNDRTHETALNDKNIFKTSSPVNNKNVLKAEIASSGSEVLASEAVLYSSVDNTESDPDNIFCSNKNRGNQECLEVKYTCLQNFGLNMRQCDAEDSTSLKPCLPLSYFLDPEFSNTERFKDYLVKSKDFRRFIIMDIVNPCSTKSTCFTKR